MGGDKMTENHLIKFLDKVADKPLMYCANKAVQAWNWTTGRTRGDLAKASMVLGMTSLATGVLALSPDANGVLFSCIIGGMTCGSVGAYNYIQHAENNASKAGCLDYNAEDLKLSLKKMCNNVEFVSPLAYGAIGSQICDAENSFDTTALIMKAAGFAIGFSSAFIMRADNLPPRKNCLKRGLDYLAEKLDSLKQPALSPVGANYFDYYANIGGAK